MEANIAGALKGGVEGIKGQSSTGETRQWEEEAVFLALCWA